MLICCKDDSTCVFSFSLILTSGLKAFFYIIAYLKIYSFIYSADYKVPKGTNIAINYWALHHDPDTWDEVDRFIPERYLDEDGKRGPKPENWLPFSAGTVMCLRESIAKPELHLIFASLMQRYKWKMELGMCADINSAGTSTLLVSKPQSLIVERRVWV